MSPISALPTIYLMGILIFTGCDSNSESQSNYDASKNALITFSAKHQATSSWPPIKEGVSMTTAQLSEWIERMGNSGVHGYVTDLTSDGTLELFLLEPIAFTAKLKTPPEMLQDLKTLKKNDEVFAIVNVRLDETNPKRHLLVGECYVVEKRPKAIR